MKMFSEKAQAILGYLQENGGTFANKDLAAALDMEPRAVVGVVNALVKRGYAMRTEPVDGVKFIGLTDEGRAVDPLMEKPEE